jgi:hypothetical protein
LGSAKAVVQELRITADSVNRYRRGASRHARADVAARIDNAIQQCWQPQVRKRRQQQSTTTGWITVETKVRYAAPVGLARLALRRGTSRRSRVLLGLDLGVVGILFYAVLAATDERVSRTFGG